MKKSLLVSLLCLLSISGVQTIKAADEIYAVLSSDKRTMTLYYDEQRVSRGGVTDWKYINGETWIGLNVTKVILYVSMKNARPTSTKEWFFLFDKLETIEHLDYLNTSNVTDMSNMFADCEKLTSLDVSNFNTSNVTDMNYMFAGCEKLTSLDISRFNTSNVTDMGSMFCRCKKLTSLDISKWNTSNVTDMSFMFQQCYELKELNLGNLNTSNVTDMSFMFQQCYELKELNLGNLNTSNVTDMSSMFDGCEKLTSLDVSNFNTSNVTSMGSMFYECEALTSLDLSNFKTFKVKTMGYMFYGCNRLQTLNLTSFTSQSLEWVKKIFYGCTNLKTIACLDDWSFLKEEKIEYNGEGEYYVLYNDSLFAFCNQLVGGNGTAYDSEKISLKYAHVDKNGQPGYFSTEIKVIIKDLTGKFTINSEGKQVIFSQGNLQYNATKNTWQFANNQYSIIGEANANIAANYSGWIDLFGWGTGNNPTLASMSNTDYATFTDWGTNSISNGGEKAWRTLTMDEWDYLINQRPAAKRGPAVIAGINGFVLLPDEWTLPSGVSFDPSAANEADNTYTAAQWEEMEKNGAVFLPCAGMRSDEETNTTVNHSNKVGIYWSRTPETENPDKENYAQSVYIMGKYIMNNINPYSNGLSVRLVHDTWPEGFESIRVTADKAQKILIDGAIFIALPNGAIFTPSGTQVK